MGRSVGRGAGVKRWLPELLPVVGALLAYGAVCLGTFVYDDHHSVRENAALRTLANLPLFFVDVGLFSDLDNRMYRPVLLSTFALNHAIAGVEPWIYKLTNLVLHALSAWLLFGLARRLHCATVGAACGATLFAVHPLASEAVNMISGRSELLAIGAMLAGMHFHLSAMVGMKRAWIGTMICAAVACGSKESGVVLVPMLVVLEGLAARREGRRWQGAVRRVVPVVLIVLVYLLIRRSLLGVATLEAPRWSGGYDPRTGAGRDLVTQLATMASVLPETLGQVVMPLGLSLDPNVVFTSRVASPSVVLGGLLLLVLTWLGLRWPRARPACFAGTALAWGTALPWVLIPLNVPLSEHRFYGPLAGLSLVVAGGWPLAGRAVVPLRYATAVVALVFAALAADRSLLYRDERALWEDTYAGSPESYRARYSLGVCAMQAGELMEAKRWMEAALAIYPEYRSAQKNLIELHLQLGVRGDPLVAVSIARELVDREPRNPFYRLLLSRSLAGAGVRTGDARDFDEATAVALSCLEIAEPKGLVFRTAAHARQQQGELEQALELLDESVSRGLDHISVLLDRHDVNLALGHREDALRDLRRVLKETPFDVRARRAIERHTLQVSTPGR